MSFIGIITEPKNENKIRNVLQTKIEDENILFINNNSISNIRNIKFKIIVLDKKMKFDEGLIKVISNSDYLLLNADLDDNFNLIENMNLKIITYGFNMKSTITASSISSEEILICIQREFVNIFDNIVEPQEIKIINNENLSPYDIMYIESIGKIYDKGNRKE